MWKVINIHRKKVQILGRLKNKENYDKMPLFTHTK